MSECCHERSFLIFCTCSMDAPVVNLDQERIVITKSLDSLVDRALELETSRESAWVTLAKFLVQERMKSPTNFRCLLKHVKERLRVWAEQRAGQAFVDKHKRLPNAKELRTATTQEMNTRWARPRTIINGAYRLGACS